MSKIEWTDKTWNPIIGCSKTSPACDHCYAERMAARLAQNPSAPTEYQGVVTDSGTWNGKTAMVESALEKPLHWRKPCRVFVGSMTDLFHHATPPEWIDKIFAVMAMTPHITYQVLTKRAHFMSVYLKALYSPGYDLTQARKALGLGTVEGLGIVAAIKAGPLQNVWIGVTVEDQDQAEARIPILLDTPAAVRYVSVEPMLGPVILGNGLGLNGGPGDLDWVICGGETGPGARPMWLEWVLDLLVQCKTSGVHFFFKRWGSYKGPDDWRIPGGELIGGQIVREFPQGNGGSGDDD